MPSLALGLTYVAGLLIAWLATTVFRKSQFNKKYKLPPRVAGPPIVGNTFQIPKYGAGEWAQEQAKIHGEMFTVQLGGKTLVFLNSSQAVTDLMDKRASLYSSRSPAPMAFDLMSAGNSVLFQPYGDTWRAQRKAMHSILNKTNMTSFEPYQEIESKQFLLDVLHKPDAWYKAATTYANSIMMACVFGKRADPREKLTQKTMEVALEISQALMPGSWLVDSVPHLDKILPRPLKWWLPAGMNLQAKSRKLFSSMAKECMDAGARGERLDCFVNQFYNSELGKKLDQDLKTFMLADLMQGGTDTTYASSSIIFAGLARYPRTVLRAREELDRVCGFHAERLPTFRDRADLPYISAIVKEGVRWRPILRIGLPHALVKDDEYKGYRFPAGTIFTWNSWNIVQNPDEYEDPDIFKPERFLNGDLDNVLKGHVGFGPGRRVCPGNNVADTNLWIMLSRLIYCFDIEEDPNKPIDNVHDTELLRIQEAVGAPFSLVLKPRSPAHAALIERTAHEVGLASMSAFYDTTQQPSLH